MISKDQEVENPEAVKTLQSVRNEKLRID